MVIEELKKPDEKIIRDDIFGMLEKYCTVIYYPLENESNCGFMLTEDSDIEILRDIASRRMRLGQYKLEIYDGLDLVNQIAKNSCRTISKKKMETTEIVQALVSPAEKLIEAVSGAIGKAYEPKHIRKIAKRASSRLVYQKITKQQNIEAVVDNTYEELEHAENVSSESVNSDWMFRFLNS